MKKQQQNEVKKMKIVKFGYSYSKFTKNLYDTSDLVEDLSIIPFISSKVAILGFVASEYETDYSINGYCYLEVY
jgi:hypothetical protein